MIVFNADLDNTLIYSYKHDIGKEKKCVEIYQNKELSFMTRDSYEMLQKVREKVLFVPTTTRTMEQYRRIDFGGKSPEFALVCNGGILLEKGIMSEDWYKDSINLIYDCKLELKKSLNILEYDRNRCFELRFVNDLFVFTKSEKPDQTVELLKSRINIDIMDVFNNGSKIYAIPKKMNKGMAVNRIRALLNPKEVVVAGDSEFDISMLQVADVAFMPKTLEKEYMQEWGNIIIHNEESVFSDTILRDIINKY